MKDAEAIEIVMMLNAAFQHSKLDPAGSKLYRQMLIDLDGEEARKAVHRLLTTARFMPTIAEIRQATIEAQLGPMRTGEEAYAALLGIIRDVGAYVTPSLTDPLMAQSLGVWGSWQDACRSPENDPAGRARFIELYDQLARRKREDQVSGIPLSMAPAPTREFTLPKPKLLPPPMAPKSEPPLPPIVSSVKVTPARPPDAPYRKLTAEDIERELAERDAKKKAGGQ